ncbi:MAG TPA: hypothetical protein VGO47_04690, partial [Chlamydiales bacterium]|nr:hypothetical protein [Chlamydiales bacterium]
GSAAFWRSRSTTNPNVPIAHREPQGTNFSASLNLTERTYPLSLKVIIGPNTGTGLNTDSGATYKTHLVSIKQEIKKTTVCKKITNQKSEDQLNILFQPDGSNGIHVKQLSNTCKDAIFKFLRNGRPAPKYCCIDFFIDTIGHYSNQSVNCWNGVWEVHTLHEASLDTGEGIVIYNAEDKPVHFAIYLTNGVYLSLFGTNGPLIIANLDEMKIAFGGATAYKLILKQWDADKLTLIHKPSERIMRAAL